AAAVRHVRDRAGAGLLPGRGWRRDRARLRSFHAALLAVATLAGRQLRRRRVRHHLEPPVVPGLPVDLQPGAGGLAAPVGVGPRPAPAGLARRPARLAPAAAAGVAADRLGAVAAAALRHHQCAVRRLLPARAVLHRLPLRLPAGPGRGLPGRTGPAATLADGARRRAGAGLRPGPETSG